MSNSEKPERLSLLWRAINSIRNSAAELAADIRTDAGSLREQQIQPVLDAAQNRFVSGAAGAKTGLVLGMKGGPGGMAAAAGGGFIVGLLGGKPLVKAFERTVVDFVFGKRNQDKPENAVDGQDTASTASPAADKPPGPS